jgi:hypothetical protein
LQDKELTYTGFEVDDLMIDLSASIADVILQLNLQIDAVDLKLLILSIYCYQTYQSVIIQM